MGSGDPNIFTVRTEGEGMEEYRKYLEKYAKKHGLNLWQAHQHRLCREAAREYGVTEEEILWLDENL